MLCNKLEIRNEKLEIVKSFFDIVIFLVSFQQKVKAAIFISQLFFRENLKMLW